MGNIIEYLFALKKSGAKLGLERVVKLAAEVGNPQNNYRTILIGGTSGKGSTTVILDSLLQESGLVVGRYTSPHLRDLRERITIDGEKISEQELEQTIIDIKEAIARMQKQENFEHPTFFEIMSIAAFIYFQKKKVDIAVLEVGLGGRLDATNICKAEASIVTNVSLEHTRILGGTVAKIAYEKAGIIKENGVLISAAKGDAIEVLERVSRERNSKLMRVGREILIKKIERSGNGQKFSIEINGNDYSGFISLLGAYQIENLACALGAIHAIGIEISDETLEQGLSRINWPGRMEIVQEEPMVILDCAKDADAMKKLRGEVELFEYKKLIVVLGISSDKNLEEMVGEIAKISDQIIITAHKVMDRAADPKLLVQIVEKHSKKGIIVEDVKKATKKAVEMAETGDIVLVTGSLFTVAEAREIWHQDDAKLGREFNEVPRK
ncbi:bifunctional folylpolyglutamate synthase/dihydrofolate synthase [Candidatus Micrarchaeota archaeon]|nr:bifunctional folylpolyglutamate synthase/dihydrofolate synthase [Candidatus Micrarchaeota archaeon]MBU1681988.1 bifunctional folylpolyglutamate synthase/dihydrofolate synthase [Candidatus Micrarchaeota archaeon]